MTPGNERAGVGSTRVSVVVPCHNYGAYLGEAVASVERQTRSADQLVVVDDGSTDDSPAVIAGLQSRLPELVVVRRSPARGAAATFNDAVRASDGDLVVILSADDRLSEHYLERMEHALADPGISFAYADAHLFGAEERVLAAAPFSRRELARGNFVNGSAMFRRSMFDAVGGFKADLEWEDWEFWLHAVELGAEGRAVDGCWLEYRRHAAGSRDTMTRWDALQRHWLLRRLHPSAMRRSDIAVWLGRSLARRAGLVARPRRSAVGVGGVRP